MRKLWFFTKHELSDYFVTPVPAFLIILYAAFVGAHALFVDDWLGRGVADLGPILDVQPWALTVLIAGLTAALWTGNQESETYDLLTSDLIAPWHAVVGKVLAAWIMTAGAVLATAVFWLIATVLGAPDHVAVAAGYGMLLLMSAGGIALGVLISHLSASVGIAFFVTLAIGLGLQGLSPLRDFSAASGDLYDLLAQISPQIHVMDARWGILALSDAVYHVALGAVSAYILLLLVRRRLGRLLAFHARSNAERLAIFRRTGPHNPIVFAAYVVIALAAGVGSNIAAVQFGGPWRADVSADGLYSMGGKTATLLAEVPNRLTLRLFYSSFLAEADPRFAERLAYVQGLMRHYRALSGYRVHLESYQVEAGQESAELAVAFGLEPLAVPGHNQSAYFGVVGSNGNDDLRIMPLLDKGRARFLALDLLKMVVALARPKPTVVGVLSPIPMELPRLKGSLGSGLAGWQAFDLLRRRYPLKPLPWTLERVPDGIDALLIVHPVDMPDSTRYAVDQYVMNGGRVALFQDPKLDNTAALSEAAPDLGPDLGAISALPTLLAAWGVSMAPFMVVGDDDLARAERVGAAITRTPHRLSVPSSLMAREDPVVGGVERINFDAAGALKTLPGHEDAVIPLVTTTATGTVRETSTLKPGAETVMERPDLGRRVLAARLRGPVASAFPDGLVDAKLDNHRRESVGPVNLIVVADVDWLTDAPWLPADLSHKPPVWKGVTGGEILSVLPAHADNARFLFSIVDDLVAPEALNDLTVKALSDRTFTPPNETAVNESRIPGRGEAALNAQLAELDKQRARFEALDWAGLTLTETEQADLHALTEKADALRRQKAQLPAVAAEQADVEARSAARRRWVIFWGVFAVPGGLLLLLVMAYVLHTRPDQTKTS